LPYAGYAGQYQMILTRIEISLNFLITNTEIEPCYLKTDYNLGYVWLILVVTAMGGLLFGWDWVVIGGAKPFFRRYFQLTTEGQIRWANSCTLIGCLAGALAAGALSDKFGRKRLLVAAAMIFAVTSLGTATGKRLRLGRRDSYSEFVSAAPQLPHERLATIWAK
jgi:hypothetical protein